MFRRETRCLLEQGKLSTDLQILANFGLFLSVLAGIGFVMLFFGQLRAIESEVSSSASSSASHRRRRRCKGMADCQHVFERLWLFLTESLLALTIFRDDFSPGFAIMFGLLAFLRCFHWITADRIDYVRPCVVAPLTSQMDQIPHPGPGSLFHLRASGVLLVLGTLDVVLTAYAVISIVDDGVSAMVLFASEYMILLASISGTAARYIVGLVDLRRAGGRADAPSWEDKSVWLFYVDLAVGTLMDSFGVRTIGRPRFEDPVLIADFAKLLTYLTFFAIIVLHYGVPLHIIRDVWMTCRSFLSRCQDLIRYRYVPVHILFSLTLTDAPHGTWTRCTPMQRRQISLGTGTRHV